MVNESYNALKDYIHCEKCSITGPPRLRSKATATPLLSEALAARASTGVLTQSTTQSPDTASKPLRAILITAIVIPVFAVVSISLFAILILRYRKRKRRQIVETREEHYDETPAPYLYFDVKAEMEDRRSQGLEAKEKRFELKGEDSRYEMGLGSEGRSGQIGGVMQELRG